MKRLTLKNLKLNANDLIQRDQLKTIFGGGYDPGGNCTVFCINGQAIPSVPYCSEANGQRACVNQGGDWSTCICGPYQQ